MNYANYESKIVEELGVALIGWPGDGKVENPGGLSILSSGKLGNVKMLSVSKMVRRCMGRLGRSGPKEVHQ